MHFTCSICSRLLGSSHIQGSHPPQEENRASIDSPKDHLHVKFPQCLPGENRRIGKLGWSTMSTGERKSTILSSRLSRSNVSLFLRPGVDADSCGARGWERQAPSAYLFVFVSKMLPYYTCDR